MRAGLLGAGAALAAATACFAPAAAADVRDAVNWTRMRGCAAPSALPPLRASIPLDQVAAAVRDGSSLTAALAAMHYPAARSTLVHLSGALGERQIAQTLRTAYCSLLTQSDFQELGVQRSGGEAWLVLAAPLSLPAEGAPDLVERRVLTLVNAARAAGRRCGGVYYPAAPALELNPALTRAALAHSRDMAKYGGFDHRGHDGSTPAMRVQREQYGPYRLVGENIAAGSPTPDDVVEGWLASEGHCENIMDRRFTAVGVAFAVNRAMTEAIYWTQDFAAPALSARPPR